MSIKYIVIFYNTHILLNYFYLFLVITKLALNYKKLKYVYVYDSTYTHFI